MNQASFARRRRAAVACIAPFALAACSTLDTLGTQTDPGKLQPGDPEFVRILAPADGGFVDTGFTIRVDRLAYESDSSDYVATRARCVTVSVTSLDGYVVDPETGDELTELALPIDRGDKLYLEAIAHAAGPLKLRATLQDEPACADVVTGTRVLATARRDVGVSP